MAPQELVCIVSTSNTIGAGAAVAREEPIFNSKHVQIIHASITPS